MSIFGTTLKTIFLLFCTVSFIAFTLLGIVFNVPRKQIYCANRKDATNYEFNRNTTKEDKVPYVKLEVNTQEEVHTLNSTWVGNKSGHMHTVVLWTGEKYFWAHKTTQPNYLKSIHCQYTNCIFTSDRRRAWKASALLFHARNINTTTELPARRRLDQYYVFYHRDRPVVIKPDLSKFGGIFNLTMTFRQDSDAPVAYGKTVPQTDEGRKRVNLERDKAKFLNGKDGRLPVAWMASHCPTENRREEYVRELQKHIQVDVYGKCGNLTCPRSKYYGCYRMIESKYKFYLAFENNFCRDYATEKLFNTLGYFVVPVVMGSANYSAMLPPHSFINVQDFESPKHLAEYLKSLDKDPIKYRAYFDWKDNYHVKSVWQTVPDGFCKLCEILNTRKPLNKVYRDIATWHFGYCYNSIIEKLLKKTKTTK